MKLQVDNIEVYAATGNRKPDPQLETVVFIHGTGQDHTIWVLPTRYFARHGKNVIAVDLPGHGRSGGAPLAAIEDMADWLIEVLNAAGLSNAALVGHSLGSLVALAAVAEAGVSFSSVPPDPTRAVAAPSERPSAPLPSRWRWQPRPVDLGTIVREGAPRSRPIRCRIGAVPSDPLPVERD